MQHLADERLDLESEAMNLLKELEYEFTYQNTGGGTMVIEARVGEGCFWLTEDTFDPNETDPSNYEWILGWYPHYYSELEIRDYTADHAIQNLTCSIGKAVSTFIIEVEVMKARLKPWHLA